MKNNLIYVFSFSVNFHKTTKSPVSSLPRIVIETLQDVSPERKCFRMVGGVLVERTVTEILPALVNNKEQVSSQVGQCPLIDVRET